MKSKIVKKKDLDVLIENTMVKAGLKESLVKSKKILKEVEARDIKAGNTYVYKHPKAGPVKVKALGESSWGDDYFVVETLEDKGEVNKGKQFNAELKNLDSIVKESTPEKPLINEEFKSELEKFNKLSNFKY
jgi:hypothetical protein